MVPLQQPLRVNCLLSVPAPAEWCMVLHISMRRSWRSQAACDLKLISAFVRPHVELHQERSLTKLCYFKIQGWIRDIWWAYRVIHGKKVTEIISHYNPCELPYISNIDHLGNNLKAFKKYFPFSIMSLDFHSLKEWRYQLTKLITKHKNAQV